MARLEITSIGAWKILEVTGWAHMIKAARTNGIDIEPGHLVTKVGETNGTPDIDLPGADEAILGCVINEPDGVLGTAFADNKAVNVAYLGSGCVVNTWAKADCGDLVENQKSTLTTPVASLFHGYLQTHRQATWKQRCRLN